MRTWGRTADSDRVSYTTARGKFLPWSCLALGKSIPEKPGSQSYRSSERGIPNCLALSTRRGAHGYRQTDRHLNRGWSEIQQRRCCRGCFWMGPAGEAKPQGGASGQIQPNPSLEPCFSQHFFCYLGDRLD